MIISIASGKGGTGKTTVASSLASIIENCVYIDCDVEEPNGHILLKPEIANEVPAYKLIPQINPKECNFCNKCIEVCEFHALLNLKTEILLFDELCHSCGACSYFCPQKAIVEVKKEIGKIRTGITENNILFFDAFLKVGESAAAPLIRKIKGVYQGDRPTIIDSPPGTSCSMFEAVKNSDYCILVTESSPFGLSDLKLAINVLKEIDLSFGIIINKYDETFSQMEEYIAKDDHNLLLKIPFRMDIAECYSKGELPMRVIKGYRQLMEELLEKLRKEIFMNKENVG